MTHGVILDTGPLVALLNAGDRHHQWAVAQWANVAPPLLTCESVVSEACFLLAKTGAGGAPVLELIARGAIDVSFRLTDHTRAVRALIRKYADQPMSVADACLVRMAEISTSSPVLTIDRDFGVYRKHGRQVIPLMTPR